MLVREKGTVIQDYMVKKQNHVIPLILPSNLYSCREMVTALLDKKIRLIFVFLSPKQVVKYVIFNKIN